MTNHRAPQRSVAWAIIASVLLLAVTLSTASATGTITPGFVDNCGIWPPEATANSQRWIRFTVNWRATGANPDIIDGVTIAGVNFHNREAYYDGATSYTYNGELNEGGRVDGVWDVSAGSLSSYGAIVNSSGTGTRTMTVGPFAAYHNDWLVGSLPITTGSTITLYLYWQEWTGTAYAPRTATANFIHRTTPVPTNPTGARPFLPDFGEFQGWNSGEATEVDPLVVKRSASGSLTNPDNGSSSDEFEFRVKYFSGRTSWPELQPQWRRWRSNGGGYGSGYANFDQFAEACIAGNLDPDGSDLPHGHKRVWSDGSSNDWMYGTGSDHHFDHIGNGEAGMGGMNPEAVLIVDRQYDNPHFMVRESGTSLRSGIVYRYTLRASNLLRLLRNIFSLSFDPMGNDRWDTQFTGISGYPTANGYVSMRAGGHTYEFLTSRDWDPPVWYVTQSQQDGGRHIGKLSVALRGRPGETLQAINLLNEGATPTTSYHTEELHNWIANDAYGPEGYGYTQNSQDKTQYPKVDPVLSAHPWFHDYAAGVLPAGPLTSSFSYPEYNFTNPETGRPVPGQPQEGPLGPDVLGAYPNPFNPWGREDGGESFWPWGKAAGPIETAVSGGYRSATTAHAGESVRRFTNDDTIYPNFANTWEDTYIHPYVGGKWTTDTNFIFRINYWQSENQGPSPGGEIAVYIRQTDDTGLALGPWRSYTMSKADPNDNEFRDGCVYYYEATGNELGGPGDYQYYFKASDGEGVAIFPNRTTNDPGGLGVGAGDNDYYWFRVNHKPQLSDKDVSPKSAPIGQHFQYSVKYADMDGEMRVGGGTGRQLGDPPFRSVVHIDYSGKENVAEITAVDPALNRITYTAPRSYATSELVNKQVRLAPDFLPNIVNDGVAGNWVVAANSRTDQTTGTIDLVDVTGLNVGDDFSIWFTAIMQPDDPSDVNYRDGAVYKYETSSGNVELGEGTHQYYFEYSDDWAVWVDWAHYFGVAGATRPINQRVAGEIVRDPEAEFHVGPEVIHNTPPHLSRFYFAPPGSDRVEEATATSVKYSRPGGLTAYAPDDVLQDKYLQILTGDAAGRVYTISGNTGDTITVAAGDPLADGIVQGNRMRIFDHQLDGYLSWAYDSDDDDGTAATPFRLYVTYHDAENNAPSALKLRLYNASDVLVGTYSLAQVNPNDKVFADGAEYCTIDEILLAPGTYTIRGQAYDGLEWYGTQYGEIANESTYFGPLTATAPSPEINVAANGPDIAPNTPPMLGFDVGEGTVASFTAANILTYTDGTGADAIGTDAVVEVDFGGGDVYRVESHDPATDTLTLEAGSDPAGDGHGTGAAFTALVGLDPESGLDSDTYTYWIVYTDVDDYAGVRGNPPDYVNVFIDNTEFAMVEYDPADTDMTDGKLYYYSTNSLSISENHTYYFMTSDRLDQTRLPSAAPTQFDGPIVHVNNAPVLTDGEVDPTSGTENDPGTGDPVRYDFRVVYTDADNHAPAYVRAHVHNTSQAGASWLQFEMAPVTADPDFDPLVDIPAGDEDLYDGSYTNGEIFYAAAYAFNAGFNQIGDGNHEFYFTAEDIHSLTARDPETGVTPEYYDGPTINDAPEAPADGFAPASPDYPATTPDTNDPANLTVVDTTTPRISWTPASDPNATDTAATLSYEVEIATDKLITASLMTLTSNPGEAYVDVPAATPLLDKTAYFYRVRTLDDSGATSDWTYETPADPFEMVTAFYVNTNHAPEWDSPTVGQFTPTGDVNTLTPLLDWPDGLDQDTGDPVSSLLYRVQVDDNSNFNDPEWDSGTVADPWQLAAGVTEAQVTAGALQWGVTYYWRVQIYDGEATSAWTNELVPAILPSFYTTQNTRPLPPTALTTPASGAVISSARPSFMWQAGSDAEDAADLLHYEIQLDADNDWTSWSTGANLLGNTASGDEITDDNETTTSMTAASSAALAIENGRYWWRVRTVDNEGLKSDWSASQSFWLNLGNDAPNQPDISTFSPEDGAVVLDPPGHGDESESPLSWAFPGDPDPNDTTAQVRYVVELTATDPSDAGFDPATDINHTLSVGYGTTTVDAPADLTRNVIWYWRVTAQDHDGASSTASAWSAFTIQAPPTLASGRVTPATALQADTVTFRVDYTDRDNNPPTTITVHVRQPGGAWVNMLMARDTTATGNLGDSDYTNGETFFVEAHGVGVNPIGDGDHEFYFTANDGEASHENTRHPLAAGAFLNGPEINDPPDALADADFDDASLVDNVINGVVITDTTPLFQWLATSDPNASDTPDLLAYEIQLSQDPEFGTGVQTRQTLANVTTLEWPAALASGHWYWRVRGIDDGTPPLAAEWSTAGGTTFGAVTHFRINQPPTWTTAVIGDFTPPTGSSVTTLTPELVWPAADDVDDAAGTLQYRVEVDDNASFNATEFDSDWLTAGTRTATVPGGALSAGVTYYWRVTARDDDGALSAATSAQPTDDPAGPGFALTFTTLGNRKPLPPASGFSPAIDVNLGEAQTRRPTFSFNAASDPDETDTVETLRYEVQLDTNNDWSDGTNLIDAADRISLPGAPQVIMTVASAELGPDVVGDMDLQYYWRVRTLDDGGLASDWSATQTFWLNTQNEAPWAPASGFLPEPEGGATDVWVPDAPGTAGVDPLMWDAAQDPDHRHDPDYFADQLRYTVQLSTNADFSTIPHEITTAYGTTQAAVPSDLTRGVTWYWRVFTEDIEGAVSADPSHAGGVADPAPSFRINRAPELSNGSVQEVVPGSIGENDSFRFEVTYSDLDAHAPATIVVIVTPQTPGPGTPITFTMQEQGVAPFDYTAGAVFEAVVTGVEIGDGDHSFYFSATDGIAQAPTLLYDPALPPNTEFQGPNVNDAPNAVTSGFVPATTDPVTVLDTRIPTIRWTAATDPNATDTAGTLTYRVEFSTTGSADPLGFVPQGAYTRTTAAGATNATPMAALPEGTWYYRIITIDDDAAESAPSPEQMFLIKLNHAPNAPVPAAEYVPANASYTTDQTPLLQWPEGTDPDPLDTPNTLAYDVQLDDNSNFSSPIVDIRTPVGQTEFQVVTSLGIGTTYYWRVRTVDDDGDTSQWTEEQLGLANPLNFRVTDNMPPNPPTDGFVPTGSIEVGNSRPTLSWNDGSDPDPNDTIDVLHYQVQLDDNDDWSDANIFTTPASETADGVTAITLPMDLTENAQHWWRVRTVDAQGLTSVWSAVQDFYVNQVNDPPTAPASGFSPAEGVSTSLQRPTLLWDPADDPDPSDDETNLTYIVELNTDATFADPAYSFESIVGQPSVTVASALTRDQWFWRVRSRDNGGSLSPWSPVQDFVVAGNNAPTAPVDGFVPSQGNPVFSLRPTLSWSDGSDPDPSDTIATLHYEVQLDDNDDWSDANVFEAGAHPAATTADGVCQVILSLDLTENLQYWYRVRTVDDEGATSDWSASQFFWVNRENEAPLAPAAGLRPNNGEVTELQRPPLTWNAGTDPDNPSAACRRTDTPATLTYVVELTTDPGFGTVSYQYSTTTPGQTQLIPDEDLADLTTWYWRVRTVDDEGARSPWSLVQFFAIDTNNQAPVLSNGTVTPVLGYLNTTFELSVVYTDADDDPPIGDIMVHVGSNSIDLVMQRDPNDTDAYSDGVTYLASVRGDHPALGLGGYEHYYYVAGTTNRHPALPDAIVGPVVHVRGSIRITDDAWADADAFEEGDTVYVEVTDADENLNPAVAETLIVTVSVPGGDSEAVQLTETGPDTALFRGYVDMLGAAGANGDGQLNVISGPAGRQIAATWADPDEIPAGGSPVSAYADVTDTIAPRPVAGSELTLTCGSEGISATIDWQAYDAAVQDHNQPDVAEYHVWQSSTNFSDTAAATHIGTVPAGTQMFEATGLTVGEDYFFAVSVADEVPNENAVVAAKSMTTLDTEPPALENWQFDAAGGSVSFELTDNSGVDMTTFSLVVDGMDVAADATWDASDITRVPVSYAPSDGWGYNRQVDFAVDASDVHGNAMATFTAQEDAPVDDVDPIADQFNPADGSTDVAIDTAISVRLRDGAAGVDTDSVVMTVNGDDVSEHLTFDPVPDGARLPQVIATYQPEAPLSYGTLHQVHVEFSDNVGNDVAADWTFTTMAEPTFEIRGTITDGDGNAMPGIQVGAGTVSATTDGNGAYRLQGLTAGDYTVTPTKAEHVFDPVSRDVTVGPDASDIDFTGSLMTYSVSGRVTLAGVGLEGVRVSAGTGTDVTTDADGLYEITGLPNGVYTVQCALDRNGDGFEDCTYTPQTRTASVESADLPGVNFTATAVTYSISGTISDNSGNRLAGVTVSDGTRSAITNEAGQFTVSGVPASTVTLTPTKSGLAFDPETREVTVPPDTTGNNFTAYTEFAHSFGAGLRMVSVPAAPPRGRDRAVDIFQTDAVGRWNAQATPQAYVMGSNAPDHLELQVRPGAAFFVNFPRATNVRVPGDAISSTSNFSVGVATG